MRTLSEFVTNVRDKGTKEIFTVVSTAKPGNYVTRVYRHEDYIREGDNAPTICHYSVLNEEALQDIHSLVCSSRGRVLESTVIEKE